MYRFLHILQQIPLFAGIEAATIPDILEDLKATRESYRKDSFIRMEGDAVDCIGIVLEGSIQIMQDDFDGRRSILASFEAGALFAEAFACAGIPRLPVSIRAETDCTVLMLKKDLVFMNQNQLYVNLLKILAQKNLMMNEKLRILSHKTTAEKLLAYLKLQSKKQGSLDFTIPFDRQALADYLGVERSAMSAEISRLKAQGVIDTRKNWFRICKG